MRVSYYLPIQLIILLPNLFLLYSLCATKSSRRIVSSEVNQSFGFRQLSEFGPFNTVPVLGFVKVNSNIAFYLFQAQVGHLWMES